MSEPCYSIIKKPKEYETSNEIPLKRRIEGDDLDKCRLAVEELLQNLLDGERLPQNLMMPIINRYQMNRFTGSGGLDKRIKKLLYILWECLPKRDTDGKFLDKMVMVCGAFDRDLKHPNQYVCGAVLRTLSKTREPEVIRELVYSIEKCLEWSHSYQRKNAVLAIARIYKNFPDLNPTAPKLIAEYLLKENDDECKRAALQALLEIEPEEARSYLHSCNIPDIHCMNASIQLLFVELIQKLFKKGSEESKTYILILTSLIKSSSSPSVRYQAAATLTRFSRDAESVKIAATCFIDICAKDSDNNVKLIALDKLISMRRINGAERVLRGSIMDILCILQSATDLELHEKILTLTLDLLSPLNVGGVVGSLKHEIRKIQDTNVLSSQQETVKYRRLLVDTAYKLVDRFPNAIVEYELLDTLFDLLISNSIGERTSSRLIILFRVFLSKNRNYQPIVIKKIQQYFNLSKDNPSTHRGLIQLLGDFSETLEQIEGSYEVIKKSLGELPIVAAEIRKAQEETAVKNDDENSSGSHLVTADGSYATQSAINYTTPTPKDDHPPLRSYYLRNKFETASVLCYALLKMACRYGEVQSSKSKVNELIARFMFILGSILHLGHSTLTDSEGNTIHINNDHSENLVLGIKIMQNLVNENQNEVAKYMKKITIDEMRAQLNDMVKILEKERKASSDFASKSKKKSRFDDKISIPLFSSLDDDDSGYEKDDEEDESPKYTAPDMFGEIPLTGTIDPIYAYCEFDVNQYDVGLKINLENRASKTFENVKIELAYRGDISSSYINSPEAVVLAPRAKACVSTNVKVVSAENRRLFGSISYDDVSTNEKEQNIVLNDISVNLTDYIKPSSIGFDDFRDVWRDCEWENKVTVKSQLTSFKDYLTNLANATNMRCVTSDCMYLSANLYARSAFGEEALVNVSIDGGAASSSAVYVKIRSRSQGMALSLGEKISNAKCP